MRKCGVDNLDGLEQAAVALRTKLMAKLNMRREQAGGSVEALEEEIASLQAQEATMEAETRAAAKTVKKLSRGLKLRWETFLITRKEMAQNISHHFGMYVTVTL